MHIQVIGKIELEDLIAKIRQVPLKEPAADGSSIFPYQNASISLRELHSSEINPTTFYLLRKNLQTQRELRQFLLDTQGIDSLHMNCALQLMDQNGEQRTLIPPVVELGKRTVRYVPTAHELTHERPTTITVSLLNDGAHRVMLARELGETVHALYIVGVDHNHPFYAHPNAWEDIQIVDAVPATSSEKKMYSRTNCATLYRNFGVLGCGSIRPPGSK